MQTNYWKLGKAVSGRGRVWAGGTEWESLRGAAHKQAPERTGTATPNSGKARGGACAVKKRVLGGRSWRKQGVHYWGRCDFEIIEVLNVKYSVKFLCAIMGVNRSSYYKWLAQGSDPNRYEQTRTLLTQLLQEEHQKHKAWGYHRLAIGVRSTVDWAFSDNLAHQCCKAAGIHSTARKYRYRKPGAKHVKYENLVHGRWNATAPMQIVVSDMTCFVHHGRRYEWTLFLNTYNNEIISHSVSSRLGDTKPYYHCLGGLLRKMGKRTSRR